MRTDSGNIRVSFMLEIAHRRHVLKIGARFTGNPGLWRVVLNTSHVVYPVKGTRMPTSRILMPRLSVLSPGLLQLSQLEAVVWPRSPAAPARAMS